MVSYDFAVAHGLKRYFTGERCRHGHLAERYVCDRHCVECQNIKSRSPNRRHRDRRKPRLEWKRPYPLTELEARVRRNLSARLRNALLASIQSRFVELFGCDVSSLVKHLESQFTEGMSWSNYGEAWQIDHIIPLAKFKLHALEHLLAAANFNNLQPLSIQSNQTKSNAKIF